MQFSRATAAAMLAFTTSVTAHIRMRWPVPYSFATLDQAPLAAADFPCKQRANGFDITTMNMWNAGQTKEISFLGSAVHGGGSCQFSLSTDREPTKDSQWKVIHSVIGGCPSNVSGNIEPADAEGTSADTFPVTLPKHVPTGLYSFAMAWINKLGDREFYMNCAPIMVEGDGGGNSTFLSSLPDMYVINMPATECSSTEGQDFDYPDPGQSVVKGSLATPGRDFSINQNCDAMTKLGAGNGKMASPSKPLDREDSTTSGTPSSPAIPTLSATPSPQLTSGYSTNGSSCTTEGAIICIGSNQFGLCNGGVAAPQPLAPGTSCANGAILKRAIHFPRAHYHHRHRFTLDKLYRMI